MLNNKIELVKDGAPKALLTWHLPREDGHFYPIAFQFSEDLGDEMRQRIFEISGRTLKIAEKQHKPVAYGSSDHFSALARPLSRLGFRARYFGAVRHPHVLQDRPIETI